MIVIENKTRLSKYFTGGAKVEFEEIKNKAMCTEKDTEYLLSILNKMLKDEKINKTVRQKYARKIIDHFKKGV